VHVFDEDATSLEADGTAPELARPRLGDRSSAAAPRLGDAAAEEAPTKPRATLGSVAPAISAGGAAGGAAGEVADADAGSTRSATPARRVLAAIEPRLVRVRGTVRERPLTTTFVAAVVGLIVGVFFGGGDEARASGDVFSTRIGGVPVVRARVERVDGAIDVRPGDECVLGVWRVRADHPTGGSWCRTQLACGGELLYGGDESGYFECANEGIGRDAETTEVDGDPALDLRVPDGALVITDDVHGARGAFRIEASIETERAVGAR
jgi:hypothetical protein